MSGPTRDVVDPDLFKRWLEDAGWSQRSHGRLGDLFQLNDVTVAVPNGLADDPELAQGVAQRVARAMGRSVQDVLKRLSSPLTDRVELRLVGDELSNGRVPLGAATETLRSARRMLSSTGTSVIAPARTIGRHYRHEAQMLARDAQLAHTEDGSFVFPLYISLGGGQQDEMLTYEAGSAIIEPYERRVTRTLSVALSTAMDLTGALIDDLTDEDLDNASSIGVSRELCLSIVDLMKSDVVDRVEVNFEWSHAFASTDSLPVAVDLHRSARPQLRKLAKRLYTAHPIDPSVYSGSILQIGRDPEDESRFYFVLDTYYRARRMVLRVNLTDQQHAAAIHWYEERATVVVRGYATEAASGLEMPAPDRVEAWVSDRFASD